MKLQEIEWADGKEYTMVFAGCNRVVVVCDEELKTPEAGRNITELYTLSEIANAEFTEVIQPVSFHEAYQDCEKNGAVYVDEHDDCIIRRINDSVELKIGDTRGGFTIVCIGRMKFTKVVD